MLENIYTEKTHNIEVEVVPIYIPEQTQFVGQFLYTYNISITNHGSQACQLLKRHWIIVDGHGRKEEIEGDGVVGEQPIIEAGESYQYSSYCPLPTPTGNMRGSFTFKDEDGRNFRVSVPLFFLREDALVQ